MKRRALPAAVFDADDPRARNSPRVVPATAEKITVGTATIGYRNKPATNRKPLTWWQIMAFERLNELRRIVAYRHQHHLDIGPHIGWANVLANLSAAMGDEVNVSSVGDLARRLDLAMDIDPDIIAGVARDVERARRVWNDYRLLAAAPTGAFIQLTAVERQDCAIKRIDAWDEPSADRKRRLARERKRRERDRQRERKRESG